jgi:acyl-CoA thioesterase
MKPNQIVDKMFQNDAFSKWLGIVVENVSEGNCQLSMTINKDMLNGFGIAHGCITYAIADSALAFASNSHGKQSVSIDTSINHIESIREGDVITAVAQEISLKNKFGFYTVKVRKGEVIIALFKGTVYRSELEWEI